MLVVCITNIAYAYSLNDVKQDYHRFKIKEESYTADSGQVMHSRYGKIMTLKTDQINHAITESIHENGEQPGLFRVILQRAIDMLMTIIEKKRKPTIPKAPEKSDLLKKYPKLKETQKAIKQKNELSHSLMKIFYCMKE